MRPDPAPATARVVAELAGVYLAMLGLVWSPWDAFEWTAGSTGAAKVALGALLGLSLIASYARVRDDRRRLGLAPESWGAGVGSLFLFTLAGGLALVLAGWWMDTVHLDSERFRWAGRYALGLVGQQVLLQCFVNNRLHDLGRPRSFTVIVAATVFATLHLPNPFLTGLTFVAGGCWVWHFRRHGNLPLLCASHWLLGTAAMLMLGKGPLLNLRVGYGAWKRMFEG